MSQNRKPIAKAVEAAADQALLFSVPFVALFMALAMWKAG